jgi:hypothetical protein
MDQEKKELGAWYMWVLLLVVVGAIVLMGLNYFGVFTTTIVERKVFEQSYQKKAADSDAVSTFDAQLSLLRRKLNSGDLSVEERSNLQAQIDSILILKSSKEN